MALTDQEYVDLLNRYNTLVNPITTDGSTPQQFITTFNATAGQDTVTLGAAPNSQYLIGVFVNLSQIPVSLYSINSDVVTFDPTLSLNDQVSIIYYA